VFHDAEYEDAHTIIEPGDLLLLYTDGVTEAESPSHQYFGEEGLIALLERLHGESVTTICRTILEDVNAYRQSERQDDVTVVALRRRSADATPRA
jgi:sigma-B regulation protein RsbU (phosphoserine phosphatase)